MRPRYLLRVYLAFPSLLGLLGIGGTCHKVYGEPQLPASLRGLADDLELPDYEKANAARSKLFAIVNSRGSYAPEARAVLQDHGRRAIDWLATVGNERHELENPKAPPNILRVFLHDETPPSRFSFLLGARTLHTLALSGRAITDDHFLVLSGMPLLEMIDSAETSITGASLEKVRLPALRILRLTHCPLKDEGICKAEFPKLVMLDVSGTLVTNEVLAKLKMTMLLDLSIQDTGIDVIGMKEIIRFSELEHLRVDFEDLSLDIVKQTNIRLPLRKLSVRCDESQRSAAEELLREVRRAVACTISVRTPKAK